MIKCVSVLVLYLATHTISYADFKDFLSNKDASHPWGFGASVRASSIPYSIDENKFIDLVPQFYFEGRDFFLKGSEAGFHLLNRKSFKLDLITRYRFFNYPELFEDALHHDGLDTGLAFHYKLDNYFLISAEFLTDLGGRIQANLKAKTHLHKGRWLFSPHIKLCLKSKEFNSYYYGLNQEELNFDVDVGIGLDLRIHLFRNLYLTASAQATLLGETTQRSEFINGYFQYYSLLGFALYQEPNRTEIKNQELKAESYWRFSYGWGNDSSLPEILEGNVSYDDVHSEMSSLFYGHPLSDTVFGIPLEVYLTSGLVHHYKSRDQNASTEYIIALKAYYTLPFPWRVRLGLAEGLSYLDLASYYEAKDLRKKGYKFNKLLNYLDISIDINLGDVLHLKNLKSLWLGGAVHHRSGIFGSSSMFGNISGGSNYNTIYLQFSSSF